MTQLGCEGMCCDTPEGEADQRGRMPVNMPQRPFTERDMRMARDRRDCESSHRCVVVQQ